MTRTVSLLLFLSLAAGGVSPQDASPDALMDAGHWKRARSIVEPRARQKPDDAELAYQLSRIRLAFGDAEASQKLAEQALAKDDKNARYHYQVAEASIAQTDGAGMFKALSLSRRARQEWQAAISLDPKYVEPRASLAEFYAQAPGIAGGDKEKARTMAEEVAALDAVQGFLERATLAALEKQRDQAARFYEEAVKAGPRNYRALTAAAGFFALGPEKQCELAQKFARDALALDGGRSAAYAMLASCAAHEQNWKELDSVLAQSEKSVSDDFSAFYQAGKTLLLDQKDFQRAEAYFRKYLSQEPEGNAPDLAAGHWRLALVLEKEGRKPDAVTELEAALKLKPNFEEAKKDLKRLR